MEDRHITEYPGPVTKLTVSLTARSVAALEKAKDVTGDIGTDVVNRALQVYAFIVAEIAAGEELMLENSDGDQRKVALL